MDTQTFPAIFAGHGSPMNAIEDNAFSRTWTELGASLARPRAILCVSAHWQTNGTQATAMAQPKTIHDFGGFPPELYRQEYPAPGSPELAQRAQALLGPGAVALDQSWGLDHGTWSVLIRMFPKADIPVVQLSLDASQPEAYHYNLAKGLRPLRQEGVLVMGSGNIVHNLRLLSFDERPLDWAVEADGVTKEMIESGDHQGLIDFPHSSRAARLAVPTNEHYLPLLYVLAQQEAGEGLSFFNDQMSLGSLSMRSIMIG
jgi:4,5-DOPA dioxygenase extradiol